MLFTTFLAIASFASSAVLANPLPEHEPHFRPRALKNCEDWMYGSITANVTGRYIPFTLNKDLELSYNGNQTDYSLKVMYQKCKPNAGGNPNSPSNPSEHQGIMYIPKLNKCLAVTNQASPKPPYYVKAVTCKSSTDPSQAWLFRWPEDRRYPGIQWVGKTDFEGTNPQGGCGIFGYKSYNKGVPQVAADKAISLGCYQTTTPIRFVEDLS